MRGSKYWFPRVCKTTTNSKIIVRKQQRKKCLTCSSKIQLMRRDRHFQMSAKQTAFCSTREYQALGQRYRIRERERSSITSIERRLPSYSWPSFVRRIFHFNLPYSEHFPSPPPFNIIYTPSRYPSRVNVSAIPIPDLFFQYVYSPLRCPYIPLCLILAYSLCECSWASF